MDDPLGWEMMTSNFKEEIMTKKDWIDIQDELEELEREDQGLAQSNIPSEERNNTDHG